MNQNKLLVFDYETSSTKPNTTQILQIGAAVLHPRTLDVVEEFNSLAKYEEWSSVESKALEVNGLTKEILDEAPTIDIAWKQFTMFIRKYNTGKSLWGNVIPCGHNICNFDIPITNRYAKRFGDWSKAEERNNLFHPFLSLDTAPILFSWFENEKSPKTIGQVAVAKHLGFSDKELKEAHTAIADVRVNYKILVRFLQFQRKLMNKYRDSFEGAFSK